MNNLEGKYYTQQMLEVFGISYNVFSGLLTNPKYQKDIEATLGTNVVDKRRIYTDETIAFLENLPGMKINVKPEDLKK